MIRFIAAAAFAAALPLTAFAQDVGIDQLKNQIMSDPVTQGMELDLDSLSDDKISEIASILSGNEDDSDKKLAIEAALAE